MAKQSGLGSSFFVGTADLSGDIGSLGNVACPRAVFDKSAINVSGFERGLLRRDGVMAFNSFWNTDAGQAHLTLSALPTTDVMCSLFIGSTVGDAAASMIAKQVDYAQTFGADGSLVATTNAQATGGMGLEWSGGGTGDGMLTTGKQSFATGTVNGTSIDLGSVSTLFGAAAYLHVFSVASGTATFAVQDSDDDISFLDVTGMVFAGATGATTERVQGAVNATVRQYVRLQGRGTHGAAVIVCNFIRYATDPSL